MCGRRGDVLPSAGRTSCQLWGVQIADNTPCRALWGWSQLQKTLPEDRCFLGVLEFSRVTESIGYRDRKRLLFLFNR